MMLIANILCCAIVLIVPALMIRSGLLGAKTASSLGAKHGFRTDTSLSSDEAWKHAQKLVGVRYPLFGVLLAIVCVAFIIFMPLDNLLKLAIFTGIVFGFEIVVLLVVMMTIEMSLQSRFKNTAA